MTGVSPVRRGFSRPPNVFKGRAPVPDCILVLFVIFTNLFLVISLGKMSIIRNMSIIRAPAP